MARKTLALLLALASGLTPARGIEIARVPSSAGNGSPLGGITAAAGETAMVSPAFDGLTLDVSPGTSLGALSLPLAADLPAALSGQLSRLDGLHPALGDSPEAGVIAAHLLAASPLSRINIVDSDSSQAGPLAVSDGFMAAHFMDRYWGDAAFREAAERHLRSTSHGAQVADALDSWSQRLGDSGRAAFARHVSAVRRGVTEAGVVFSGARGGAAEEATLVEPASGENPHPSSLSAAQGPQAGETPAQGSTIRARWQAEDGEIYAASGRLLEIAGRSGPQPLLMIRGEHADFAVPVRQLLSVTPDSDLPRAPAEAGLSHPSPQARLGAMMATLDALRWELAVVPAWRRQGPPEASWGRRLAALIYSPFRFLMRWPMRLYRAWRGWLAARAWMREVRRLAGITSAIASPNPETRQMEAVAQLGRFFEDTRTPMELKIKAVEWLVYVLRGRPEGAQGFPSGARRAAVRELERVLKRHGEDPDYAAAAIMAGKGLESAIHALVPGTHLTEIDPVMVPAFLNFGALFDYLSEVRTPATQSALDRLSPSARIALELGAYSRLLKGEKPAAVSNALKAEIWAETLIEFRLRELGTSVGEEVEIFKRSLNVKPTTETAEFRLIAGWKRSAEFMAAVFGIEITHDQLLEYSPGPGVHYRSLVAMTAELLELGLIPPAQGDYAKLHVSVVHPKPDLVGVGMGEWRLHAQTIALLEGLLAVEDRRLIEADSHLTSLRYNGFKHGNLAPMNELQSIFSNVRAEHLPGSVSADPQASPEVRALHVKAMRMIYTLHTAYFASLMAHPRHLHMPQGEFERYWAANGDAKRRLAALYEAYWAELNAFWDGHRFEDWRSGRREIKPRDLIAAMDPSNYTSTGDFSALRENSDLIAELDALVSRHVAAMDEVISSVAAGTPVPAR